MKKLFLFSLAIFVSVAAKSQNLLATYNEGFESIDASTTGNSPYYWWSFYNNAAANATLTDETTTTHTGGHAAKVTVGTAAAAYQPQLANGKTITLVEGHNYKVTFWIKATTGGGTVQASDNGSALYGPNYATTTVWTEYSQSFTATAGNLDYQLWIHLGGSVDIYYVDDASIVDLSVLPTQDYILNGNLELGSGDNFTNWGKWNGAANLTQETVQVHGGTRALKAISTGSAEYNVQFVSDVVATTSGQSLTAIMWIKGTNGGNTVRISTDDGATQNYGPNTTIGTSWQKYSYSFTGSGLNTRLKLDLGGGTDTFYIDDIQLLGIVLGIEDINAKGVTIYPNPVTDRLFITTNRLQAKTIRIVDVTGKIVNVINNAEKVTFIDVANLSRGIYILITDTNKQFKFLKN